MDMTSSTFLTNNFDHGRNGNSEVTLIKNQLGQLQDTVALMEKRLDDLEKGTSSVETELAPTETLPTYSEHASTSTLPTPILDNGQLSLLDPFDSSRENDELWKLIFAHAGQAALRSAFELKIFEAFGIRERQLTVDEIAKSTGAHPLPILRIMRAMSVTGVFKEVGLGYYAHNSLSLKLMDPTIRAMALGFSGSSNLVLSHLPDYLTHINGQNPLDASPNLTSFATDGAYDSYLEYLQPRPQLQARFEESTAADTIANEAHVQSLVSSLFEESDQGPSKGHVTIVHISGGRENVLNNLRKERPGLGGRFVIQGLRREIDGREPIEGIETRVYDMFTPQPITNAKVYLYHHIFRNYPDATCHQILKNLIPSMSRDSRLVIADAVLPEKGAGPFHALRDVFMIGLGGCERTESQWRMLLKGAGLKVKKVVTSSGEWKDRDGLIEAVKFLGK